MHEFIAKVAKIIVAMAALLACTAWAADTKPKIIAKIEGWTVLRSTDPMSDVTKCTAFLNKDQTVTLTAERIEIFMKGRGGFNSAQFRFDKEQATGFWPRMESDSPDLWWFSDMDRVLGAFRMLVRIEPVVGFIKEFDIDLRPAKVIHEILTSERCK